MGFHEILQISEEEQEQVLLSLIDAFGENYWYSNSTVILGEISSFGQTAPTMAPEHFHHSSAPSSFQKTPAHIFIENFIILLTEITITSRLLTCHLHVIDWMGTQATECMCFM